MYKYYSRLGFSAIKKNEEGKDTHNEIFKNILHFIKKLMRADCIQDGIAMYNDKVILLKI